MSDLRMAPLGQREARLATLARNWWVLALRGVMGLLFGAVVLLDPAMALGSLVLVGGIYLLVDGAFAVVSAVRAATHHRRWALLFIEGLLGIALGVIAIGHPDVALTVAILLLSVWALVSGVLMLVAALNLPHGRWLLGLGGLVSIIWGVLLYTHPFGGAVILTIWLGAYALVFGITLIAAAIRLRGWHNRHGAGGPRNV